MKLAAIDLGSNTLKYTLAEVTADALTVIRERAEITRIGQGLDKNGYLLDEAMERTYQVLAEVVADARTEGAEHITINRGATERFHDLATIELEGPNARPMISIFEGKGFALPYALDMMERHPLGSQAFYPLGPDPFLVTVAPDDNGKPGTPVAFLTAPGQGFNIARLVGLYVSQRRPLPYPTWDARQDGACPKAPNETDPRPDDTNERGTR